MITVKGILTYKFYGERDRHKKRERKKKTKKQFFKKKKDIIIILNRQPVNNF